MNAREQVDRWNGQYPVGQPVRFWRGVREGEGQVGNTRSKAWEMCEAAVVLITGATGGIALSHVEPLAMPELSLKDNALCEDLSVVIDCAPPVCVEFDAATVLVLIGHLQLALRHPMNRGESSRHARDIIEVMKSRLPEPCHEIVDRGWHQEYDAVAVAIEPDEPLDEDERWELTDVAIQSERLQQLYEYLDDPQVLTAIPQPHRLRISELLHGAKGGDLCGS